MGLWTMIFLIVIAGMAFAAWKHHNDVKMGIARDQSGNPVRNLQRETELQTEVEQLRERIQVLERIATDNRETDRLSSEIDKLRTKD